MIETIENHFTVTSILGSMKESETSLASILFRRESPRSGVWLNIHKENGNNNLVLVFEGLFKPENSFKYDFNLFSLATIASSFMFFHSPRTIDSFRYQKRKDKLIN